MGMFFMILSNHLNIAILLLMTESLPSFPQFHDTILNHSEHEIKKQDL